MEPQIVTHTEPLRRDLSRLAIAVLAINGIVGAGIFGLPADAARLTGAFSPFVFVVCGLLMSTVMISFAQAASYFHGTGGPILYTSTAFGPFVGFQSGWILYIGRATSLAANGNLLATYLAAFLPGADVGAGRVAVIVGLAAVFALLNVVGVREGMRSVMVISVVKFFPLLLFALVGIAYIRPEPFAAMQLPLYSSFGEAVLLVFYAFIGFEGALIPAGESRDPRRDIPRALFAVAAAAACVYLLIQVVCVSVLPDLATTKRPLADAAGVMLGAAGVAIVSAGAVVSILGNYAASVLSAPRMTYALARDGHLPAWFGAVHERYRTPHWSVLFYCALAVALGLSGTFTWLAGMSSFARILGYLASIAALPRLRARFGGEEGALRLPGGMLIPIVAFVISIWLLAQAKWDAVLLTAAFVGAGGVLYAIARRRGARSGV
jgi:amino acid transporter